MLRVKHVILSLRKFRFCGYLPGSQGPLFIQFLPCLAAYELQSETPYPFVFKWTVVWLGHILTKLGIVQKVYTMPISSVWPVSREKVNCLLTLKGSVWLGRIGFSPSSLSFFPKPLVLDRIAGISVSNLSVVFGAFLLHWVQQALLSKFCLHSF